MALAFRYGPDCSPVILWANFSIRSGRPPGSWVWERSSEALAAVSWASENFTSLATQAYSSIAWRLAKVTLKGR